MMPDIFRLWRTVRHLKPIQIYGRAWFRLKKVRPDLSPAPPLRVRTGDWQPVPARSASLVAPLSFRFLNVEHALEKVGWDDPALPKLWRYNLHYFDDLQAVGWQDRAEWHRDLLVRWLAENPPAQGSGWEPYPMSLRIVNWVKWSLSGGDLLSDALQSLAVQTRALADRMEWHLLGNHLFVNGKALLFAGHLFDGDEAATWRAKGLQVLQRELDEQFLPDGGQFELSPMYHALGFEDLLDIINLERAFPGLLPAAFMDKLRTHAEKARLWLERLSHPDGRIAFFNDAAFGIAPENSELMRYADALGIATPQLPQAMEHLAESGYARLSAGPAILLADLARIGPDYLPGHAHADSLSFELSCFGHRVFVNSGTGEYGDGAERLRQRGTSAHNTVELVGLNSSEVWGGFRVGRRARVHDVSVSRQDTTLVASASHDGYAHLPGNPIHHRRFVLNAEGLSIEDSLTGSAPIIGPASARFHLHPDISVAEDGGQTALILPDGKRLRVSSQGGALRVEPATWHPEFGLNQTTACLVLPLDKGRASFNIRWD